MKKRILVIDDDDLVVRSLKKLLNRSGFEIVTCQNGDEALRLLQEKNFDLIICDVLMPEKNGVDTIRDIRNAVKQRKVQIPVVFLTGYADASLQEAAQALEPVGYIFKPFDADQLINTIRNNVNKRDN